MLERSSFQASELSWLECGGIVRSVGLIDVGYGTSDGFQGAAQDTMVGGELEVNGD